ncbi:MAG TPA: hypothetical protein VME23_08560 [Terracidiphilus sp.]|nr:hypothetical protein [Terracidiphilus sp.]
MVRPGTSVRRDFGSPPPEASAVARCGSIPQELRCAESAGFRVSSLEDWTSSCAATLRVWIDNLQHRAQDVTAQWPRESRSWLFYLIDTAARLEAGELQYTQFVLSRPNM